MSSGLHQPEGKGAGQEGAATGQGQGAGEGQEAGGAGGGQGQEEGGLLTYVNLYTYYATVNVNQVHLCTQFITVQ